MGTIGLKKVNVEFCRINSPISPQSAWQIESFLLKTFEYGDYSFKRALAGKFSSRLQCTFFIAKKNDHILAAAGSLYSLDNPTIAILGPVCVEPSHRKKGLATALCELLLEHLKDQGIEGIYLGVKDNSAAVNLYKKLGFEKFSGIVMRNLFVNKDQFNKRYSPSQDIIVRKMDWCDFAEVSALFCEPADMHTFNYCQKIFSAKYVEPDRFLPVFQQIMNAIEKNSGFANILQIKEHSSIVGAAHINIQASKTQSHIAVLDFFVLDGFLNQTERLVYDTIKHHISGCVQMIICYCLSCDTTKKLILKSLGAKPCSTLPGFIKINNKFEDVLIYKL